jgi:hypothetical protein
MGYRSEVTIICESKAYEMFKNAWKKVEFKPDVIRTNGDHYAIQWSWVKRYSGYEDVKAIEEVMKKLDREPYCVDDCAEEGYAYHQIEIGEDNRTEERSNDWATEVASDYYVTCSVEIPDYLKEIKED